MGKTKDRVENWADYYDHSDILGELLGEPVHFSLNTELQKGNSGRQPGQKT